MPRVSWDEAATSGFVTDWEGESYPFIQSFWFAWHVFHPDSELYRAK